VLAFIVVSLALNLLILNSYALVLSCERRGEDDQDV
jgi:hypothetical protein